MMGKIIGLDGKNTIVGSYGKGLKVTKIFSEDKLKKCRLSPLFKRDFSCIKRNEVKSRMYWTLDDITEVSLYFYMDDTEIVNRPEVVRQKYHEKAEIVRQAALNLIRSKVWDGTLTPGKDIVLYGKDFGDDPRDSIYASTFVKIVDEENEIIGDFSIIEIPYEVREIAKKREKIKAAEKKSDGEIVLAYLKSEFIEDIRNGVSKEELMNKFTSEGLLVSTGTQKHYKYTINSRKIIISKERLGYIASILLDPDVKVTKKAA